MRIQSCKRCGFMRLTAGRVYGIVVQRLTASAKEGGFEPVVGLERVFNDTSKRVVEFDERFDIFHTKGDPVGWGLDQWFCLWEEFSVDGFGGMYKMIEELIDE